MPSVGSPALSLVLLVAVAGGGLLLVKNWSAVRAWITSFVKRAVPSESKGGSKVDKGHAGGDDSGSPPVASGGRGAPSACPDGPDGSGVCDSDNDPPVPNVPVPPGCDITLSGVRDYVHANENWQRWPIIGSLRNIFTDTFPDTSPSARVQREASDAADGFRAANELYLNTYAQLEIKAMQVVRPLVEAVLGPNGLIALTSELAGTRASLAVYELLPTVLALCIITLLLVWAI